MADGCFSQPPLGAKGRRRVDSWRLNRPGKDAGAQMKRDERKKTSLGGLGLFEFRFFLLSAKKYDMMNESIFLQLN